MSTTEQKSWMREASVYLNKVKVTFQDEKEKYNIFVDVLRDYKAQRIDVESVKDRVKVLFKGHRDLLEGFNFFLPKEFEITIPLENEHPSQIETVSINSRDEKKVTVDDAIAFVHKVKVTFPDEREKYKHFLYTMEDYKAQRIDTASVAERMKQLFKGHDDLLVGFNAFMPKKYEIILPLENGQPPQNEPVVLAEVINFIGKIKAWIQGDNGGPYRSFIDRLYTYRREVAECLQGYADLLHEFTKLFIGCTEEEDQAYLYAALN